MNIKLLTTTDPNNKVTKTYTENLSIDGQLKEKCSILKPKMLLEVGSLPTSNYAYIADFGRYYFIDNMVVVAPALVENNVVIRNMLIEVSLAVDVLMSFDSGIRNLTAVISRQENIYNLYLADDAFKAYGDSQVVTKEFPSGFSGTEQIYLVVAG